MFLLKCVLFVFICAAPAFSECDFNSSKFITELAQPSSIIKINVSILDSRKWSKNAYKIITSKAPNIASQFKRKFKAKVQIDYTFGKCEFEAKIRQSGDWKDHIRISQRGGIISSIDISLRDGNILNAVEFKLLLPETRSSENEVLGTVILRHLGYIAPETFIVNGTVNDVQGLFLFQENAEKELIERNKRREGPVLEGDEELLWSFENYKNLALENVALSRLSNPKWAKRGPSSMIIALQAYQKMQLAYMVYIINQITTSQAESFKSGGVIFPNVGRSSLFANYAYLLVAMGGEHALRPHNRKYYFRALEKEFEPIYYDGDLEFKPLEADQRWTKDAFEGYQNFVDLGYFEDLLIDLNSPVFVEGIRADFNNRVIIENIPKNYFDKRFETFVENVKTTTKYIKFEKSDATQPNDKETFLKQANTTGNLTQYITSIVTVGEQFEVLIEEPNIAQKTKRTINTGEMLDIISKNRLGEKRTTYVDDEANFIVGNPELHDVISENFEDGLIYRTFGTRLSIDPLTKTISIIQGSPTDWLLFYNISLENWAIVFDGKIPEMSSDQKQRFNSYGVTGCLNLYSTKLSKVKINITNGQCEDSLNIVNSLGTITSLTVTNSYADAVDMDFSEISIDKLNVVNAGNDCFDVSGGVYSLNVAQTEKCNDKGFSIGEKSNVEINSAEVIGAAIGVSVKDSSFSKINFLKTLKTKTCIEGLNKKQEFGGGNGIFLSVECSGDIVKDSSSYLFLGD